LTISLDATYSTGDRLSGVGLYSHEILYGLAAAHPETGFHFCYRLHRYLRSWRLKLPPNVRKRLILEPFGPRDTELFHGLNQRLPLVPLRRSVATFHDLFVMSGEYSTPEFRERFTRQARDAAAQADVIIAVSKFTRDQVVSLLGVDPSRIRVVHHGVRRLDFPVVERQKVILNVGAIQTRKNIARLVEAFETVDRSWRLVLAGSEGYGSREILARIDASPARERISVTGYVTPEELAGWYAKAEIFAFPSLDEGFGMPVLEAMSAGTPVVTSNCSALPEVAGDAAILVNPESTEELAEALCTLTQGEALREALSSRGVERARLFTWEKAVAETWNVYREVLG